MGVIDKLARFFGFRRERAAEAIVAHKPATADLTVAELAVMRRRRLLDGARARLAKAQAQVDGGDTKTVAALKRWQRRVDQHERVLEVYKRRLTDGR